MGNCLPFIQMQTSDDLTRLSSQHRRTSDSNNSARRTSREGERNTRNSSSASSSSNDRTRRNRNLCSSSYVNELYMGSVVPSELSNNEKTTDQKRQARIRGLLEQIPIDIYVAGGKGSVECAICMVEFEENEKVRFLPCMHNYHVECIDDWLLRSFTCPSCMEAVDSAILSTFTATSTDLASLMSDTETKPKLATA